MKISWWSKHNKVMLAGVIMAWVGAFMSESAMSVAGGLITVMAAVINQLGE